MTAIQPFFLPAAPGQRFCIYHPPANGGCQALVLHVHAFAEEMNKARRMVALQARALARAGVGVLLLDLYGCGDSSGQFADARWEIWQDDIRCALTWLRRQADAPISLWGLRLGVPLMLSYAAASGDDLRSFIMWQPVVSGDVHLTQFLRLRLAGDMLASGRVAAGTRELKQALKDGKPLEIAGYELAPALAAAMEQCSLAQLGVAHSSCHWFEVAAGRSDIPPASRQIIAAWRGRGVDVATQLVSGEPFWTTLEIAECPDLIAATAGLFAPVYA